MLALRMAWRYLFSKKSFNAVNILSIISVVGVAIATAAMIVVLSVFNGFTDLAKTKLSMIDPDLLVAPQHGKIVENADSLTNLIEQIDGVKAAAPVVKEQALAVKADAQMPVRILGLSPRGVSNSSLRDITIDGSPIVEIIDLPGSPLDGLPTIMLSVGVANEIGLRGDIENIVKIYVPKRRGRINTANPASAFRADTLIVSGVFRVDQAEYDADVVIIPLSIARHLLDYRHGEASAIQVFLSPGADIKSISDKISNAVGSDLSVLDRYQQQQESFNMISIEKWVTLMLLVFILIITSFNIISAIYILKVEKRDNIIVLKAVGASERLVRNIFAWQGRLITIFGGIIGLLIGSTLVLVQQFCGIVKLKGADTAFLSIEAYPVRLEVSDIAIVLAIILTIALITSFIATFSLKK